ncbi:MAG: N-formylglutamate deformylase [Nevskia sp.]|nr:N-formylglutamate deformylase [Nevskia sp.]
MSTGEKLFTFVPGVTPVLIDVPHAGTYIPPALRSGMTAIAQTVPDTDWHVHLLYEFALQLGVGLMVATHSRYVVDLNRDPDDASLYPGADTTELCPTRTFADDDIYLPAQRPDAAQIASRRARYWLPYHAALNAALAQIKARHGYAILLDAHSIRAQVPRFFAGVLPDLNLGTADGAACDLQLQALAMAVLQSNTGFSSVCNGRFKGGYITRHYGRPRERIHALQLEMAQTCYMAESAPYAWEPQRARALLLTLKDLLKCLLDWRGAAR